MNWPIIITELSYRTSRSSGAGGQHVNKTETKVEVLYDVSRSAGLTDEEKALVIEKLVNRMNADGIIAIRSQKTKSQLENKEIVTQKLHDLLEKALIPAKKRKETKPSKAAKEERLAEKKKISQKKEVRRKPEL